MLEVTPADSAAEPMAQFFTPPQFAALRRLAGLIQPPMKNSGRAGGRGGFQGGGPPADAGAEPPVSLGALDCGVPEFLDFLISVSPADRKLLYRNGLDGLNASAKKQFNKAFADLDDTQANAILQPLVVAVPWVHDPPADPMKHFLFAVRQDIPMATRNSPEFNSVGGRRAGGGFAGSVWDPIDPVYRG